MPCFAEHDESAEKLNPPVGRIFRFPILRSSAWRRALPIRTFQVHLAAGMLAAGYRSVVGTNQMWSIIDQHGGDMAEFFYEI